MLAGMFASRAAAAPPAGAFWDAIAATSPEVWLKLNEASGAVAANSGTGTDASYEGTVSYGQGALSDQSGADSIETIASPTGYIQAALAGVINDFIGVIGLCYAGVGAASTGGVAIPWRLRYSSTTGAYLRIDEASIGIRPQTSGSAINTGVASSIVKDGAPHLIIVGRLSDDSGNLRMWIDGTEVWSQSVAANGFQADISPVVARNGSTAQHCLGRYADFFIAAGVDSAKLAAINAAWAP